MHVRLQAPRQQFEGLGFDVEVVEKFGERVKGILNGGFTAPIEKVDTEVFKKALSECISEIDQQEEK